MIRVRADARARSPSMVPPVAAAIAGLEPRAGSASMRCPYCGGEDTQVKDSRPGEDGTAIRRRRVCVTCGGRFTTFERVQLRELTVVKRSGRRVAFDRDKLMRSVQIAIRKRPVDPERVEQMVSGVVRQLESLGESEVASETIGELVMAGLKALDDVAYVRFASVYRNFREAKDFEAFLGELASRTKPLVVDEG
jgi:transcriptional repressor NrdR